MEGTIKRITRLLALLTQLQTKRLITSTELAEKFSVSARTVYRDIKILEEAGVPILTEEGKGYRIMEEYRLPPLMFTEEESNALITANEIIAQNNDASLVRSHVQAIDKVKAALRWDMKDKSLFLTERTRSYTSDGGRRKTAWLSVLQSALTNHRVIRVRYHSPVTGKTSDRTMEPFALLFSSQGFWLIIALCRLRKAYRMLRVDGITELIVTDEKFQDHALTLDEFFQIQEKNQIPLT